MNIIFFGSSNFAVEPLGQILRSRHKVLCVVTQPDRKSGRGLHLGYTPVKQLALEKNLKLYQPESINSTETLRFLKDLNADLFVVVAYGKILPLELLNIPRRFAINLHASLLPKYRGAAPINWAIIKGEKKTGVSIIKMSEKMDTGEIILQKDIDIKDSDTAISLEGKLSKLGKDALIKALDLIEADRFKLQSQNEEEVTFAPKLKKSDGLINWSREAIEIRNLIRGCLDWPGAFTHYRGKILKIWEADVDLGKQFKGPAGSIIEISKQAIFLKTGKDNIAIKQLQLESGRRMNAEQFISGHSLTIGVRFG